MLGCGLLVVVQALANMAVAVNLVPVTGQPMPLVSRGGTSTLISCIYFGIILSVSRFGANIGLGGEVYATDRISVGLEAKYNIIKDLDAAALAVRVGYNF